MALRPANKVIFHREQFNTDNQYCDLQINTINEALEAGMMTGGRTSIYAYTNSHIDQKNDATIREFLRRYEKCDPVVNCLERVSTDR